uniref:Uncharacterized protein n=1 Tax=Candidatus Kentrum sp. LFY TaxID=2126342 RepID=A0A450V6R2_9GAMM|nr:MAG: hypothetical protein BECKLFY1418A_GA0070994_11173 [Candidatus Kentron sp. LFY]
MLMRDTETCAVKLINSLILNKRAFLLFFGILVPFLGGCLHVKECKDTDGFCSLDGSVSVPIYQKKELILEREEIELSPAKFDKHGIKEKEIPAENKVIQVIRENKKCRKVSKKYPIKDSYKDCTLIKGGLYEKDVIQRQGYIDENACDGPLSDIRGRCRFEVSPSKVKRKLRGDDKISCKIIPEEIGEFKVDECTITEKIIRKESPSFTYLYSNKTKDTEITKTSHEKPMPIYCVTGTKKINGSISSWTWLKHELSINEESSNNKECDGEFYRRRTISEK